MNMPEDNAPVEPVKPTDIEPEKEPKYGGLRQIAVQAAVSVVVTFGMLYFLIMPQMASKTGLETVVGDVAGVKTSISTLTSDLSRQISQLSGSISDLVTADRVNSLISSQITPLRQDLNTLTSKVNGLPTSMPDIAPLKKQLDDLQKTLDDLTKDVAKLKETPTPVPAPTISSFTPTSGATGASVVITGTNFTGATAVYFGGTLAQSFTVNSATQVTAIVGNGSTGYVSVTTSGGTVSSTGTFTFTGAITTPTPGQVTVTYSTSPIPLITSDSMNYSNNFNITITNKLANDIFNGQLKLTIQYMGLNPADYSLTPLSSATGIIWGEGAVGANNSLEIVGDTGFYLLAGGSKTITIKFSITTTTPFTATQYIKITGATYTGYMQ